jgi:hypothetical protein
MIKTDSVEPSAYYLPVAEAESHMLTASDWQRLSMKDGNLI